MKVNEDLLDIKIFSSMNTVLKEKIRSVREESRTLELKKESLSEKVTMQENFIEEIESRGKKNIVDKTTKIGNLNKEIDSYSDSNVELQETFDRKKEEAEKLGSGKSTLAKLNNLKGKMSQKVVTITADT